MAAAAVTADVAPEKKEIGGPLSRCVVRSRKLMDSIFGHVSAATMADGRTLALKCSRIVPAEERRKQSHDDPLKDSALLYFLQAAATPNCSETGDKVREKTREEVREKAPEKKDYVGGDDVRGNVERISNEFGTLLRAPADHMRQIAELCQRALWDEIRTARTEEEEWEELWSFRELSPYGDFFECVNLTNTAPSDVAALLAPVARALALGHAIGLAHCDVKPENLLVVRAADGSGLASGSRGTAPMRKGSRSLLVENGFSLRIIDLGHAIADAEFAVDTSVCAAEACSVCRAVLADPLGVANVAGVAGVPVPVPADPLGAAEVVDEQSGKGHAWRDVPYTGEVHGSPTFRAPELVGLDYSLQHWHHPPSSDVFAMGRTIACCILGAYDHAEWWRGGKTDSFGPALANLVRAATHPERRWRPSMATVAHELALAAAVRTLTSSSLSPSCSPSCSPSYSPSYSASTVAATC